MSSRTLIKKVTLTVSVLFGSVPVMASDQWAMYQANPSHTGYVPVSLNAADITFRWKINVSSSALSPVTAAQNHIYVSDPGYFGTQHLYAIFKNGTLDWGKAYTDIFSVNPPSYADGKVYVQTGNHTPGTYLRAYNAENGNVVFQSAHEAQWERYLAPTIYKGNVYINGGYYGGMYSFNGTIGKRNWFYGNLPQVDGWTPAVDEKWAYSYIGALYAIDRITGKLAFTIANSSAEGNPVPMLGGASDVFVIDGGMLTKFKTDTRKIAWQKTYGFGEDFAGNPALANGVVYAGTSLGTLVALDQLTGKILWTWKNASDASLVSNIIATKTHVFVGTASNTYCINIQTHKNVWSYAAGGHLTLAESALYIAGSDGKLTAFKLGLKDLFAPSSNSYGQVTVGATVSKNITIRNVGDKSINVSDIVSGLSDFKVETSPTSFVMLPGQAKSINVSFTPSAIGMRETNLIIKSDDPNEPQLSVYLIGKGI